MNSFAYMKFQRLCVYICTSLWPDFVDLMSLINLVTWPYINYTCFINFKSEEKDLLVKVLSEKIEALENLNKIQAAKNLQLTHQLHARNTNDQSDVTRGLEQLEIQESEGEVVKQDYEPKKEIQSFITTHKLLEKPHPRLKVAYKKLEKEKKELLEKNIKLSNFIVSLTGKNQELQNQLQQMNQYLELKSNDSLDGANMPDETALLHEVCLQCMCSSQQLLLPNIYIT